MLQRDVGVDEAMHADRLGNDRQGLDVDAEVILDEFAEGGAGRCLAPT